MYGDYYENTYAALTRSTRAGEPAPKEKLVFIGARHGYYPKFVSDAKYGIGGIGEKGNIPVSYAALDEKYKNHLIFGSESDYAIFLSVINDASNYPSNVPADVIAQMKAECFDLYINYIFTFKFAYSLYGAEHDIILKGHPREVIGANEEWNNRYTVNHIEVEGDGIKETKYSYDKLLDAALCAFHAKDSVGKLIGMVPYGTAAENLAYLLLEPSHTRLTRIVLDYALKCRLADAYPLLCYAVGLLLFGDKVTFRNFYLLLGEVAAYLNQFHAVEQWGRDVAEVVGCGYEHDLRQVVVDVEEIVVECVVLFRVEYLEQC
jgi:hypothetical protein